MRKLFFVMLFTLCSLSGLAQDKTGEAPKGPSNKEILARGTVFFVKTDTAFVLKEELEKGLIRNEKLERWGLQVTQYERDADFVLNVRRAPFTTFFPYTVTDRHTGKIVIAGEPNSLGGTVPGKIAADIAEKLKKIYEPKTK